MKALFNILSITALLMLTTLVSTAKAVECYSRSDVIFLVDHSGSIRDSNPANGSWDNWELIKNFLVQIVQNSNVSYDGVHYGLVTFGNSAINRFNLTSYTNNIDVTNAIKALQAGTGETNLYAGLTLMRSMFQEAYGGRPDVPKVAVILTDGKANVNVNLTVPEAQNAILQDGIKIFVVGITDQIDEDQIRSVSSPPNKLNENYWTTPDFTKLNTILATLQNKTCTNNKNVYEACREKDLLFAFSFPPTQTNWNYMRDFMKNFITEYLPISPSEVRVSVLSYTYYTTTVQFALDKYQTEQEVKAAIDAIVFTSGSTANPTVALNAANNLIFKNNRNVQKVMVLFIGDTLYDPAGTANAAQAVSALGIRVIALDVTSKVSASDLKKIGTKLQDNIQTTNYNYLQVKLQLLGSVICGSLSEITCPRKADIILVLDESTSIAAAAGGYANWDTIKNFAASIAESFPVSSELTKIGLIKFSNQANVAQKINLNAYTTNSELKTAILKLELGGGETNIADALRQARAMFDVNLGSRSDVPHILILVTDGQANREADQTIIESNLTKAANISIYTVGVTNQIDENQLKTIATAPYETHYFYASDYDKLNAIIALLVSQSCLVAQTVPTTTRTTTLPTTPSTTSTPPTTTRTTTTSTTTTTTTSTTTTSTTTTPTTTTPTTTTSTTTTSTTTTTTPSLTSTIRYEPNSNCIKKSDVVFVVHRSTNMNFQFYQDFVLALIQDVSSKFDVTGKQTQVAAVSFSDRANVDFFLNNYTTAESLKNAITKIAYGGYGTNLAAALNIVRTSVFTSANGARTNDPTVSKVVVVILNYPSDSQTAVLNEADLLRKDNVGIFSVGSGSILNRFELAALANYPFTRNMATVDSSRNLLTLSEPIKRFACGDDSNCIINPCLNGGTCRDVANQVICECQSGKTGARCEQVCNSGGDIVFAVDASRGIELINFLTITNYISNVVQSLSINGALDGPTISRVGLLTFDGNNVTTYFNLNTYPTKSQIIDALRVPFTSGPNSGLINALDTANNMFQSQNGDRANIPNYLVVISHGDYDDSNDGLKNMWQKSITLRNRGINIISIGIGNAPYLLPQLTSISTNGGANVQVASDATKLNDSISFVADRLCQNKNYCTNSQCVNNAQCTSGVGDYTCGPCPSMTTGTNCERRCTGEIDLAFVLLSGGVVHRERFQNLTNFAINIVNSLDISENRTRVALIFWANDAQVAFYLNSFKNKYDVIQAIKLLPYYMGGGSNTSGALRILRRSVFNQANGDRPNAQNIAIIVANGPSTIDVNLTVPEAIQNRIDGNVLIPIALEAQMSSSLELFSIASEPRQSTLIKVDFFRDLPSKVPTLVQTLCNSINECQFNSCNNRGLCTDQYMTYMCNCNGPYGGRNCERTCNKRLDVIILLDISGSTEEEYLNNIALTKEIIYGLPVDNDNARVAMVAYSDDVSFQNTLDSQIRNKNNLINLVDFHSAAGRTNTPSGFDAIINNILNKKGDRSDVPNYVIVITDGESNVNQDQTIPKAKVIKDGGSTVLAVGVGNYPNGDEIRGIATSEQHVFYYPLNKTALDLANSILDKLCN